MGEQPDIGGPLPEEIERLTNVIVQGLGQTDLETALTVLCNLTGQVLAALAEGKPSVIQEQGNNIAENVKKAAITKLWYDDNKRREAERE